MTFSIHISILFASIFLKMNSGAVEVVIYGCIRGLDGRIPDCKLRIHANCFHDIQEGPFLILVAGSLMETMDWTGSKAVASTYSHCKDIGNYPNVCNICLKCISVGCVSLGKKSNDCLVYSLCYKSFHLDGCLFFMLNTQASCFP